MIKLCLNQLTRNGDSVKMNFPDDLNGDVFRRMEASGFNFNKEHVVDFHAVMATEEEADKIAQMFMADDIDGEKVLGIETKPFDEGGMEINLSPAPIFVVTFIKNLMRN